jgi:catechol 2,3-dioxygenase-like lactoylglutathione lyase family enzyme
MRGLALFVAGILVGIVMMFPSAAQPGGDTGLKLNHFGISVKNFDETVSFYTRTLGAREAFMFRDKEGKPALAYLQISRDTFVEVAQANADRPAGVSHIGVQTDDIRATVARLRQIGFKVDDPRTGTTKAPLTSVFDPDGVRIELVEFTPESMQRKAVDAWK